MRTRPHPKTWFATGVCLLGLLWLSACGRDTLAPSYTRAVRSTDAPAAKPPAADPQKTHLIAKGDTLYSIAWQHDLDYKELAAWNRIQEPYLIYAGQFLRLVPPPPRQTQRPTAAEVADHTAQSRPSRPKPANQNLTEPPSPPPPPPKKPQQAAQRPAPAPPKPAPQISSSGQIQWKWPTQGEIVRQDTPTAKKGINIAGQIGQDVHAAAPGQVVYSGSGLSGYGKLIIIKHNKTWLSAYAYNSELLVREGEQVRSGQVISKMGRVPGNLPMLHFEIRKNGKPTNPSKLLPKSRSGRAATPAQAFSRETDQTCALPPCAVI